jgi:hypothetical protein
MSRLLADFHALRQDFSTPQLQMTILSSENDKTLAQAGLTGLEEF